MEALETGIKGLWLLEPKVFGDERGWFTEKLNAGYFESLGYRDRIVQVNHSFSTKGVLRGLHFQRGEQAQSKTVYCVRGRLFDVAVDIRPGSETYGKWFGAELTAENKRALLVPRGFAHGFYALDDCELLYFVGNAVYDKSAEGGLRWNCGQVGIEWPLVGEPQVNERDAGFPGLDGLEAA